MVNLSGTDQGQGEGGGGGGCLSVCVCVFAPETPTFSRVDPILLRVLQINDIG